MVSLQVSYTLLQVIPFLCVFFLNCITIDTWSAGLGLATHQMYLAEIAPRKLRGVVSLTLVTFASLGKVSAQFFGLRYSLNYVNFMNM